MSNHISNNDSYIGFGGCYIWMNNILFLPMKAIFNFHSEVKVQEKYILVKYVLFMYSKNLCKYLKGKKVFPFQFSPPC